MLVILPANAKLARRGGSSQVNSLAASIACHAASTVANAKILAYVGS
jgi:hypothetical protein